MSFLEKVIDEISRCTNVLSLKYKINTTSNNTSGNQRKNCSVDFKLFFDGRNNLCDLVSRQTNHQPQYNNNQKSSFCVLNALVYFFVTFLLCTFSLQLMHSIIKLHRLLLNDLSDDFVLHLGQSIVFQLGIYLFCVKISFQSIM